MPSIDQARAHVPVCRRFNISLFLDSVRVHDFACSVDGGEARRCKPQAKFLACVFSSVPIHRFVIVWAWHRQSAGSHSGMCGIMGGGVGGKLPVSLP